MVEVRFAANIVNLVVVEGKYFVDAVDEVFPEERKSFQSSNISVLLAKQALPHFFLYENIFVENKVELNNKQKCLVYVVLTNNFYTKVLSKNNCNSFLEGELPKEEFEKLKKVLSQKEPLEDLISFEKDSDFYFATKYNAPIWLVHMWRKHYGDNLVKDFLEACTNYHTQSYAVNTIKTTTERLLLKYPDFSSPFEDMLIYDGIKRYKLTPEFKNDEYIDVKMGFKNIIDTFYNPLNEVLVYSGYDDDFVKAVIIKGMKKQSINVVVPDLNKRAEVLRFIRMNDIHNVNFFEANDEFGLRAGVSYKQDIVAVFPKGSRFDNVSKYPDFLLHFDRDTLDSLIEDERRALELCYDYVNEHGTLLYMVNTLNKKESSLIIKEFLEKHPDFELERDEQLIASHPFGTTMYWACMHRKAINND